MITAMLSAEDDFEAWRDQARRLARIEANPHDVIWQVGERPVDLFAQPTLLASTQMPFGVPKAFVDLAEANEGTHLVNIAPYLFGHHSQFSNERVGCILHSATASANVDQ